MRTLFVAVVVFAVVMTVGITGRAQGGGAARAGAAPTGNAETGKAVWALLLERAGEDGPAVVVV